MAKAKVNISCVEKFNNAVVREQSSANALKSATENITKIINDIDKELNKISAEDKKCKSASQLAIKKRGQLESRLKSLQTQKANTSPTKLYKYEVGIDEDGNKVYREERKPNPDYQMLENEITICKAKISKIKELEAKLSKSIADLINAKHTHEDAKKNFTNYKKELLNIANEIIKKSTGASSQLKKAIAAIRRYKEETVRITPAPSHTSINWEASYSPTYLEYYYDKDVDDIDVENDDEPIDTETYQTYTAPYSTYKPPITSAPKSVESISSVHQWIRDINPNYYNTDIPNQRQYQTNCGSCALAVYNRLNGTDRYSRAGSKNIPTDAEMERVTGRVCTYMSVAEISQKLREAGPGSHFIAGINRSPIHIGNKTIPQSGHWFNIYYDGHQIYTIEGQTGEIYGWPHDYGDISEWCILV